MASKSIKKCTLCNAGVAEGGVREERVRNPFIICEACLDRICPEREGKDVFVDKDGNLYLVDDNQEKVTIFFSYGGIPYSSYTEVHTDDVLGGCDQFVVMAR
jgi:hypothetical protein